MSLSVSNFKDQERDITFINLNHYLNNSFKEYILYITENELILSRADKNKLGLHFIINQLLNVCSKAGSKKWFYYKTTDSIESKLVKRLFNTLPSNITYDVYEFENFLTERDYIAFNNTDISTANFQRFFNLLRRYKLQALEKKFKSNINIKRSLLP
tara:strand:- start:4033 stop:4503 length:471 start_codon:yes stop_codon:yes gene_type:complete